MRSLKNPNSILFIYEGYTEEEFYHKLISNKIPKRKLRISYRNAKGIFNLNKKVKGRITEYLNDKSKKDEHFIHVFIAYDREGPRETETIFNIDLLRHEFIKNKKSRIKSIKEIVATQDLESWFFYDIIGIYNFLNVPENLRQTDKYSDVEKFNNYTLAEIFVKHGKVYFKRGKKVEGFLDSLNLDLIYSKSKDLKLGIDSVLKLC